MNNTIQEVFNFIEENDVKFIKLAFCDIFGTPKNISIMSYELERAFKTGISFDASAVKGFMNVEESDLFLHPDLDTVVVLPWRPQQGRVIRFFCTIKYADGTPFEGDGRGILKETLDKLQEFGYECNIGSECEFYLFELNEKGRPTKIPHDDAGYCEIAPRDKGENVRREICLTLEEMGIKPESSHHEQGPGQNEIDFKCSNALSAADQLITFKSVVKTVAARNGLFASFMPKPLAEESGNGLHINISLAKDGKNIFTFTEDTVATEAESFTQGILDRIKEITAFLNPIPNSYTRLGKKEAPKYITWSHQNRSQLIRIPAAKGEYSRIELRVADPACNPYIAFALLISAGLEGIKNQKVLSKPIDKNLYEIQKEALEGVESLPKNLQEALAYAKVSAFVKEHLPARVLEKYSSIKEIECTSKMDEDFYFHSI